MSEVHPFPFPTWQMMSFAKKSYIEHETQMHKSQPAIKEQKTQVFRISSYLLAGIGQPEPWGAWGDGLDLPKCYASLIGDSGSSKTKPGKAGDIHAQSAPLVGTGRTYLTLTEIRCSEGQGYRGHFPKISPGVACHSPTTCSGTWKRAKTALSSEVFNFMSLKSF